MVNKNILVKKRGVVILDLEKYQEVNRKLAEHERKEKLLRSLEKFENLTKWGMDFAEKKKIIPKQILDTNFALNIEKLNL